MADQRPAFRFRLPWSAATPPRPTLLPRPPAQQTAATTPNPAQRPTATPTPTPNPTTPQTAQAPPTQPTITATPTPSTPQTAETQVPTQPSDTTASAPTPQTDEREATTQTTIPTNTSPTTVPQRAEIQIPNGAPPATTTPIPTAERPPFRPPGVAPAQAPLAQSQTSRTESQPSSPSRVTTQPRVPSQPVSPPHASTESRAASQPSTPPRAAPQPRAVSLPSSSSRRSPQLPSTPRITTSRRAGQTSSSPSPPSITAQPQPTTEAVNQPISASKGEQSLTGDKPQPSSNSTEVVSPLADKQEPKSAVSETPSLELQSKPVTIPGIIYDSKDRVPAETRIQPNKITQKPSEASGIRAAKMLSTTEGPEIPAVTQISNSSSINGNPESFPKEIKPEETKEVKEVMQETKDEARDGARQTLLTKEQLSTAFQSEQTQETIGRKEITATSPSNGAQTKITIAPPRNKTMVADTRQKLATSNGEHISLHEEIKDDISKLVNEMAAGNSKPSTDDRPVSVITLAGENRGASMHVGSGSSRKEGAVHIHRGYKIKPDDSAEATTDGEESFKEKSNNPKTEEDQASEAYVNCNVQGINNSIIFNSSITERNPGVHLIGSHFPIEPKKPSEKSELHETRKAEFNLTPSHKLTHEPTVRRRCLRGMFLESSDSDLDTTKPRRHGCRVGCNDKSKENNIDVL
ncbi:hypothetical protein ACH5RR_035151 [Cinchona calisaya]|uniref:Proteoglycan 4-like n=1 Tax=Cinchona calisaya TaxID=153742 RepID=A0ABD2YDC2_9GENT